MVDVTRPRLLDLFCGGGGAAMGYHRVGFDVTGVDIVPQPHYPFPFRLGDALTYPLDGFDVVHASPPCQAYSVATRAQRAAGREYPDLIAQVRARLDVSGMPYIIENVPGAPIRPDLEICGCMVGLPIRRRRWFECSWSPLVLHHPHNHPGPVVSVVGHGTPSWVRQTLGYNPTLTQYQDAMGIGWMNRDELSQAIPPPYTELVGTHALAHLLEVAA